MLWSMHLGRAAGMSRSSRARFQPRFESLENRLTPTTGMLPPMIGGEPLVVPDLSAPSQMPVIAAEAPTDNAESPSDNGTVGAEEPPLIVGGDGTLPVIVEDQASEMPPEEEVPPPPAPPIAQYEEPTAPTLPPVGQFEPPPIPSNEMPPDIVHWGDDEIVPTPTVPVTPPVPAVSIGEPASGFGEIPATPVSTPTIVAPVSVVSTPITTPTADTTLNVWLTPSTSATQSTVAYSVATVDQVFSTPTQPVAASTTTTKTSEAHADLFGVGDATKDTSETDLLGTATHLAKAKAETQQEAAVEAEEELIVA
jgi:mRNA-degrading endonuclease toxin of MazEF toxin-antitoxin module